MRSIQFNPSALKAFIEISKNNASFKRTAMLLKEIMREPTKGAGKPEPLKHQLSGLWSRRINQKDRIVYAFDDQTIYVYAIGGHYDDN